jgi:hypothetical protein
MSVMVNVYVGERICDYCRTQVVSDLARYEITDAETDFTKLPKGIWEINDVVSCASHLNDACLQK